MPDDIAAALPGRLPLVLSAGEGWEMRRPLGLAIVRGPLLSQWLTQVNHRGT